MSTSSAPSRLKSASAASATASTVRSRPNQPFLGTPIRAPRSAFASRYFVKSSGLSAIAPRRIAASVTVRVIGPAVSWLAEIGMMPVWLTRPTVGFSPTSPHTPAGDVTAPSVPVPIAPAHGFPGTATAEPLLDPDGERSSAYGLRHCPPRALHPDVDGAPR